MSHLKKALLRFENFLSLLFISSWPPFQGWFVFKEWSVVSRLYRVWQHDKSRHGNFDRYAKYAEYTTFKAVDEADKYWLLIEG